MDRAILEIYLNDGETVFTTRYYADFETDRRLEMKFNCAGADIYAWEMQPMPANKIYDEEEN